MTPAMIDTPSLIPLPDRPPAAALLVDQCRRWRRGERVLVEAYLERHSVLRADGEALLDLLYNEVVLRQQHGEVPGLDEYLQRFPHLAPQLRVQFALDQALQSAEGTPSAATGSGPSRAACL